MNFSNVNYTHELQFLIAKIFTPFYNITSRFASIFTYIRNLVPDCNFVKRWFANYFHDGILWSLKVEIKKRPPLQKQLRRTARNVPLFCQSVKRRRDSYFYSRYNFLFFYSSTMFKPEAEQYFHVLELVSYLSKDRLCFGITFLRAETQINSRCMELVLYCMAPSGVNWTFIYLFTSYPT